MINDDFYLLIIKLAWPHFHKKIAKSFVSIRKGLRVIQELFLFIIQRMMIYRKTLKMVMGVQENLDIKLISLKTFWLGKIYSNPLMRISWSVTKGTRVKLRLIQIKLQMIKKLWAHRHMFELVEDQGYLKFLVWREQQV